ncbi:MAG TPA: hypothetical protein ENL10_04940 [Candidatus Cloacimonetes bacterium]|nr:hypothetical protein [Candidatus Cloacimonadota bacterium]
MALVQCVFFNPEEVKTWQAKNKRRDGLTVILHKTGSVTVMPEDIKICENSAEFEEFQPLICSKTGLSYGTTIHFDMNGVADIPGTDRTLGTASLWINADYWSVYHDGQLKFDSETIDRDRMQSFDSLFSGKRFLRLADHGDSDQLLIIFDGMEIEIDKPEDEVYDLLTFYLPNGEIYYYSDALYKSHEIDEERRSLWENKLAIWAGIIYERAKYKDQNRNFMGKPDTPYFIDERG